MEHDGDSGEPPGLCAAESRDFDAVEMLSDDGSYAYPTISLTPLGGTSKLSASGPEQANQ